MHDDVPFGASAAVFRPRCRKTMTMSSAQPDQRDGFGLRARLQLSVARLYSANRVWGGSCTDPDSGSAYGDVRAAAFELPRRVSSDHVIP